MPKGTPMQPALRGRILDAWAATVERGGATIAADLGMPVGTLRNVVAFARRDGDPRAIVKSPGRKTGWRKAKPETRALGPDCDHALHLWATTPGMSASEIAAAAGMKLDAFNGLIQRARQAGDPRAVDRDGKPVRAPREPGAPSTRRQPAFKRGPYRTRSVARALRDDILNSWAEGLDGETCGMRHGVRADYVHTVVRRARETDDPRAVGTRAMNRFTGCSVSLREAVTALARVGIEADDTAIIVGVTRARVREVLTHAGAH